MTKTNKKFGRKVSMIVSLLVGMVMLFSGISLISAKPAKNSSITVFASGEYIIRGTVKDDYTLENDDYYSGCWHDIREEGTWNYDWCDGDSSYDYDEESNGIYIDREYGVHTSEDYDWEDYYQSYDGGEYDYDGLENGVYIDKDYVYDKNGEYNSSDWDSWDYSDYDDDNDGIYIEYRINEWLHRSVINDLIYEYYLESDYEEYKYDMLAILCSRYYNEEDDTWYGECWMSDGYYYYDYPDEDFSEEDADLEFSATVIGYTTSLDLDDVVIPGTIRIGEEDVTVKELNGSLFSGSVIKRVTLCEGIEIIGSECFSGNSDTSKRLLEEITFPNTLTWIGDNAFARCNNIKKINLANDSMWFHVNNPANGNGSFSSSYSTGHSNSFYANPFWNHSRTYGSNEGAFVNGVKLAFGWR